jgi:hypothetical protein
VLGFTYDSEDLGEDDSFDEYEIEEVHRLLEENPENEELLEKLLEEQQEEEAKNQTAAETQATAEPVVQA